MSRQTRRFRYSGFTLIELLIVLGIIGLLLQLILPAVEMARESARRVQCTNNIRQMALAVQAHEEVHKRLPSGGWTAQWAGEPERGTDVDQPGSWIFNLLDYVEESNLRRLGKGLKGKERADAMKQRLTTPVELFYCPSRRLARCYPQTGYLVMKTQGAKIGFRKGEKNTAKSDYAANAGGRLEYSSFYGLGWKPPKNLAQGDNPKFVWPTDEAFWDPEGEPVIFNGVIYGRSRVRFAEITDGLTNTYLIGEKNVQGKAYRTGRDGGDNENMYAGFGTDTCRSAYRISLRDTARAKPERFGSAHPSSFNMAFVDGSVHPISYMINRRIYRAFASRYGDEAVDTSLLD